MFERLELKLEEHPGQLTRAAVELAKAWRTDKFLRRLDVCSTLTPMLPDHVACHTTKWHFVWRPGMMYFIARC